MRHSQPLQYQKICSRADGVKIGISVHRFWGISGVQNKSFPLLRANENRITIIYRLTVVDRHQSTIPKQH